MEAEILFTARRKKIAANSPAPAARLGTGHKKIPPKRDFMSLEQEAENYFSLFFMF